MLQVTEYSNTFKTCVYIYMLCIHVTYTILAAIHAYIPYACMYMIFGGL